MILILILIFQLIMIIGNYDDLMTSWPFSSWVNLNLIYDHLKKSLPTYAADA